MNRNDMNEKPALSKTSVITSAFVDKQKLEFQLNFLFNIYTQKQLAFEIGITQWELLTKMKDNSFTDEELLQTEKITNQFTKK